MEQHLGPRSQPRKCRELMRKPVARPTARPKPRDAVKANLKARTARSTKFNGSLTIWRQPNDSSGPSSRRSLGGKHSGRESRVIYGSVRSSADAVDDRPPPPPRAGTPTTRRATRPAAPPPIKQHSKFRHRTRARPISGAKATSMYRDKLILACLVPSQGVLKRNRRYTIRLSRSTRKARRFGTSRRCTVSAFLPRLSGIGIAQGLSRSGAEVACVGRDEEDDRLASAVSGAGCEEGVYDSGGRRVRLRLSRWHWLRREKTAIPSCRRFVSVELRAGDHSGLVLREPVMTRSRPRRRRSRGRIPATSIPGGVAEEGLGSQT